MFPEGFGNEHKVKQKFVLLSVDITYCYIAASIWAMLCLMFLVDRTLKALRLSVSKWRQQLEVFKRLMFCGSGWDANSCPLGFDLVTTFMFIPIYMNLIGTLQTRCDCFSAKMLWKLSWCVSFIVFTVLCFVRIGNAGWSAGLVTTLVRSELFWELLDGSPFMVPRGMNRANLTWLPWLMTLFWHHYLMDFHIFFTTAAMDKQLTLYNTAGLYFCRQQI